MVIVKCELWFLMYIFKQEAGLEFLPTFRESFIELHQILKAIKEHDLQPALEYVV